MPNIGGRPGGRARVVASGGLDGLKVSNDIFSHTTFPLAPAPFLHRPGRLPVSRYGDLPVQFGPDRRQAGTTYGRAGDTH